MFPGIQGIHPVIGASAQPVVPTGATPTFVAHGGLTSNASSSNPVNVAYPAGIQANDIIIIQMAVLDSTTSNDINIPAGFTQISAAEMNSVDNSFHATAWKRATGSESGTVNITATAGHAGTDALCGIMSLWRGCVAAGTPYEGLATGNGGSNTSMQAPACTTTNTNRRVVHMGGHGGNRTATPAAGYAEIYDAQANSGTGSCSVHMFAIEKAAAGVQAAATHTISGSQNWNTVSIALIHA